MTSEARSQRGMDLLPPLIGHRFGALSHSRRDPTILSLPWYGGKPKLVHEEQSHGKIFRLHEDKDEGRKGKRRSGV